MGDVHRKLAAILAADVVEFSRRIQQDEVATVMDVKSLFAEVVAPKIEARRGHVFKTMGDGILAMFDSAVDAVWAAHDVQEATGEQGELELRVAVHAGDVLIDDDDIFGDGVNIAVRLQEHGDPGEVVVSGDIYRAVHRKLPFRFESRGVPPLKNISEPIEVFAVVVNPPAAPALPSNTQESSRPSIIVLPFANLSSDPEQEYFCDGLTQDITTELSKFSQLFVFAAASAFTYKGRAVRPSQLYGALGVRYLLEGSVQKSGEKMRLNAQLIDAPSEHHLWAERLDRGMSNLLDLQDELVKHIVSVLSLRVSDIEMERVSRKETASIDAYDAFLRGAHAFLTQVDQSAESEASLEEAETWFRQAIDTDPNYARAWGWLGYVRMNRVLEGWVPRDAAGEAEAFAKRAVALRPDDYDTHWALGFVYSATGRPRLGLAEFEEARLRNPNDAGMLAEMAETLTQLGRHDEAVEQIRQAMTLNPYGPEWYHWMLGWVLHHAHDYNASIVELERIHAPSNRVRLIMAANHARLARAAVDEPDGRHHEREAKRYLADFLDHRPDWTREKEQSKLHFERDSDLEHWLEGLSLAGLP